MTTSSALRTVSPGKTAIQAKTGKRLTKNIFMTCLRLVCSAWGMSLDPQEPTTRDEGAGNRDLETWRV